MMPPAATCQDVGPRHALHEERGLQEHACLAGASRTTLRADLANGVRYVLGSRALLSLALMLVAFNFVGSTPAA